MAEAFITYMMATSQPKARARARTRSTKAATFTEAAGLVAIHPLADALADEVPYFAWLLRFEAYQRYGFDPDGVFK